MTIQHLPAFLQVSPCDHHLLQPCSLGPLKDCRQVLWVSTGPIVLPTVHPVRQVGSNVYKLHPSDQSSESHGLRSL